jgi:hypothetical protein
MDRIEKLLSEFTDLHTKVVSHSYGIDDDEWQRASDKGQEIIDCCHDLLAALEGLKELLGPYGEYAVCRADGSKSWLGDDMIVGAAFEKADAAIARAKGE